MAATVKLTHLIGKMAGTALDRALDSLWPMEVHKRQHLAATHVAEQAAEDLAEAEAARDVYEPDPPLADWEKELRDGFFGVSDDLWAAEHKLGTIIRLPENTTIDELVADDMRFDIRAGVADTFTHDPLPGAGPRNSPQPAQGRAGKATTTPEQNQVAHVIAVVLRGQGINSAAIYADLAARELGHHFDITRK
jgi:hypothetical protein